MFERLILSPRGFKVYLIFFLPMLGLLFLLRLLDALPLVLIDYFQYRYIWGNHYVSLLSVVILAIPVSFFCFCIGFVHDLLTSQGVFSARDDNDLTSVYADSEISYHETIRQEYVSQVRSKYHSSIIGLKSLGFEEMKFYNEVLPWFGVTRGRSGIFSALGVLLSQEIIAIGKKISIKIFSLGMVSPKDFTYASISSLGVSFYTKFTDGTFWVSSNFWGAEIHDASAKIHKTARLRTVEATYLDHKQQIKQFIEEGKYVVEKLGFDDYVALGKSLNDYMMKKMTELSPAFVEKESSFMVIVASSLAGVGTFAFGVFLLIFLLNVVSNIYPACTFVAQLRTMSLSQNFLLLVVLLGGSWLLARSQDSLMTVNGCGTLLYGRAPVHTEPGGYISTKWLAFFMIPLLPVRSYWIMNEYINPRTKRQNFQMRPTPKIDWGQVRATVQSWLWRYLLYIFLMTIMVSFVIWRCNQ